MTANGVSSEESSHGPQEPPASHCCAAIRALWRRRGLPLLIVLGFSVAAIALPVESYFTIGERLRDLAERGDEGYFALGERLRGLTQEGGAAVAAEPSPEESGGLDAIPTTAATVGAPANGAPNDITDNPSADASTATDGLSTADSGREAIAQQEPSKHISPERRRHAELVQRCLSPKKDSPCSRCCNDGEHMVPCLDVEACAARAPSGGRYAFALVHVGRVGWPWLTFLNRTRHAAGVLAADTNGTVEILLLMPASDVRWLTKTHLQYLQSQEVKLLEVPWTLPPALQWHPSDWWPGKPEGWCGPQDLVRLHVLGLEDYDAVAFYDQDVELQGSVTPVFRCAATGKFLTTSGGAGEPLNAGFFAVRPSRRLLLAAEYFAGNVTFSAETGWGRSGFAPAGNKFVGAECGQGFFHTLYYKRRSPAARQALEAAGVAAATAAYAVDAAQVDRCIWNYQNGIDCNSEFDCDLVRAHHKPTGRPVGRDCGKLALRATATTTAAPHGLPPEPDPGPQVPCRNQTVEIGMLCNRGGENDDCMLGHYIKRLDAGGFVRGCEAATRNPSGDTFCITTDGGTVIARREDAAGCWCDENVRVTCCVVPRSAVPAKKALSPVQSVVAARPPARSPPQTPGDRPAFRGAGACSSCCNDGYRIVPCLDVDTCAATAPLQAASGGNGLRFAFILAHVGRPGWPWLVQLEAMRAQATAIATNATSNISAVDIVLLMVDSDAQLLTSQQRALLERYTVRLLVVPWAVPPNLTWHPLGWQPNTPGWCGPQDLVRLHAFGLVEYDAVAFYDQDVELQGDVSPVLRCASTGRFLSAGGLLAPLNLGFFAVRPDHRLVQAAELFAVNATFNDKEGWVGSGFAPSGGRFIGAECGQGLFHTLLYKREHPAVRQALSAAGVETSAAQVDRCIWNYQGGQGCGEHFDCARVRAHHKPFGRPEGQDCGKRLWTK